MLAEEIVSVQPMMSASDLIFTIDYDFSSGSDHGHTPGDGTFCECWGRCYVCHPLTDEERAR